MIRVCVDKNEKKQLLQFFDKIVSLQRLQYSVNYLKDNLNDSDSVISGATVRLLGYSQNQQAIQPLLKFVLSQKKGSEYEQAVTALQRLVWEARP